ncbi:PH domain-containing protein [Brachybacterium saurashtrense]|uniref:Low molecular weight protein antigen 6 PH domain-containing protein n=1 Tax=Brachybacterium saurashtrense TaxID=556288 RepID=A0A345YKH6_9MICO|nr:PH domain-containing protein [Brachybacterium saurashtrense]AXK44428.1 hypothetical protein DWV08_01515 [Brachybacterium saurashtrense]RRR23040.1 hypothetical protein DXU92_06645 [Brachybacterium saurashtrense]
MPHDEPSSPPEHDDAIALRPRSATVISLLVWVLGAGLAIDAVLRAGWQGVAVLPVPVLIMALVWAVLWLPRVVVHRDRVEVRNIVVTHHVPFAALEKVRLGAMLRLDVAGPSGVRTLTAWNAPALGRENPLRREAVIHEQNLRGRGLTRSEKLAHDQQRSRSAVLEERFVAWMAQQRGAQGAPGGDARVSTRPNLLPLAVLAVCVLLVLARTML